MARARACYTELHQLIIDELIFSCVMGEFLPLFLPELAGGLLFAFLKKEGGLPDHG